MCAAATHDPGAVADAWRAVTLLLDVGDVCALTQTCRSLRHLVDEPHTWRALARRRHGPLAALHGGRYSSPKALVLDDARAIAAPSLSLDGRTSDYLFAAALGSLYQCRLLALQWHRDTNCLRLYFDARGELDLRHPLGSSLALVQHGTDALPGAHAVDVAAAGASAWSSCEAFRPDTCELGTAVPGHFKGFLVWGPEKTTRLLSALLLPPAQPAAQPRPPQQHVYQQRGRRSEAFDEWTSWELELELGQEQAPEASAASSVQQQPQQQPQPPPQQQQRHLVFCYANDLGSSAFTDYSVALLASSPPSACCASVDAAASQQLAELAPSARASWLVGLRVRLLQQQLRPPPARLAPRLDGALAAAWQQLPNSAGAVRCGLLEVQLVSESAEQERARWQDLPWQRRRGAGWWV